MKIEPQWHQMISQERRISELLLQAKLEVEITCLSEHQSDRKGERRGGNK